MRGSRIALALLARNDRDGVEVARAAQARASNHGESQALIRSFVGSYIGRSDTSAVVRRAGDVDRPRTGLEPVGGHRLAGLDHGQADGAAERPAVRRGADVADHLAVAQHQLGVVQQRPGVGEPDLDQPAVRDSRGLAARPPRRDR